MLARLASFVLLALLGGAGYAQVKKSGQDSKSSERAIAERVATERALNSVCGQLNLTCRYAWPIPAEQPFEFVIARAIYDPNDGLFQSRLQLAAYTISTLAGFGPDLYDSLLGNAARSAIAEQEINSDAVESLEVAANEGLTQPIVTKILKASSVIDLASRDQLRDHLTEALKRHPEHLSVLSKPRAVSVRLQQSRDRVDRLIQAAKATK